MTLMDKLLHLMKLRGIDTTGVTRIDQAIDKLIEAEKPVEKVDTSAKKTSEKNDPVVEETAEEDHLGF